MDKSGNAHPHSVEPLDEWSAAELLRYHAGQTSLPTEDTAREPWLALAQRLGRHPLAMQLAGAWLLRRRFTPAEFLQQLDAEGFFFWDTRREPKENLRILISHSADAVFSKQPQALESWYALALHGHAPLPLTTLAAVLGLKPGRTEHLFQCLQDLCIAGPDKFPCESGGQPVRAWQLSHSLLGEWGREELFSEGSAEHRSAGARTKESQAEHRSALRRSTIRRAWFNWWAKDLERCFQLDLVPGGPQRYAALQPHWDAILCIGERKHSSGSSDLIVFLTRIGNAHRSMGNTASAELLYRRAVDMSERLSGLDQTVIVGCLSNLANLISERGDRAVAEPSMRRALAVRERELGPRHPDTLSSMCNLALLLTDKGELAEAESLNRRAIEGWELTGTTQNTGKIRTINNLAILLKAKHDLAGAELLFRQAAEEGERMLGAEHPDTLASLGNVANLLADRNDPLGAEPLYRRVLAVQERKLGPKHPDTLMTANNLATLLGEHGDLSEAELLAERAVRGFLAQYGVDHVHSKGAQGLLARIREARTKETGK